MADATRAVQCVACGYDLAGLTEPICPECGGRLVDAEGRRVAAALIEAFRDDLIANAELIEAWPRHTADPTLAHALFELNTWYRDYRVAGFATTPGTRNARRGRLTRWVLFLRLIEPRQIGKPSIVDDWYPFADENDLNAAKSDDRR